MPDVLTQFPFVGGHAAIDFINTCPLRDGRPHELLFDEAALMSWGAAAGLVEANASEAKTADLASALVLRSALSACVAQLVDGETPDERSIATINRFMANSRPPPRMEQSGAHLKLIDGQARNAEELLTVIAWRAADLLTDSLADRVRQCAGERCVLWFLDTTRNRSRNWCRMDRCGARAKAASYYQRKKKGPEDRSPGPSNSSD